MICVKCSHEFEGNYCPKCGQKAIKERYTVRRMAEDTIDTFEIRGGFVTTLQALFKSPGTSIKNHIIGKSVMYNPLKLLLIIGAVSTYCTAKFFEFEDSSLHVEVLDFHRMEELSEYSGKYFTFTNIVGIPIFAIVSWSIFKRDGYNYFEHLILNTYITIAQLIMMIAGALFFVIVDNDSYVNIPLLTIQNLYFIWVFIAYFGASWKSTLPKAIITIIIGYTGAFFANYLLFLLIPNPLLEFFEIF